MERNELYPVFLKVSQLNILIVGGGNVAEEKLTFLLKSSPNAQVEMISPMYRKGTRSILVNVADNPPFCDFYMGGIVTKGNVKVAISTNGKSPTTAKRLRQFFEDVIPENIDDLVKNLNEYRKTIKGDFEEKVETLNEFTKGLVNKKEHHED